MAEKLSEEELGKYGSDRSELAPIIRDVRDVVSKEEVDDLEKEGKVKINKGVSNLIFSDILGINNDPVLPIKKTTLNMVSVVEQIPIPSVNQVTGLTTAPLNVFERDSEIQYYTSSSGDEVSYPNNFISASGANIRVRVIGDLNSQYILVVKDITNTTWYDWDNDEFNNGYTEKSGIIDGNSFNLLIPPKQSESVYHAYFKGIGSANNANNLPTEEYPWVITQLKNPTVTFKFADSDGYVPESNTVATFNPGSALNVSTSLANGTNVEITVKPKRSTLSLKDNTSSNVSTGSIYGSEKVETLGIKSSNLTASVSSDGKLGTISGTITLEYSPLRDLSVLISPEQIFKIT